MLSNTQKSYAIQMQQQSLSRIRKRISHLNSTHEQPTSYSTTTIINMKPLSNAQLINSPQNNSILQSKQKSTGFSARLEILAQTCQELKGNVRVLNNQKRGIAVRINVLKQNILKDLEIQANQHVYAIQSLSNTVKQQIIQDNKRHKQIEQDYYKNVEQNNEIKVVLIDLRNKINQIQHRLGFHATIWQKI